MKFRLRQFSPCFFGLLCFALLTAAAPGSRRVAVLALAVDQSGSSTWEAGRDLLADVVADRVGLDLLPATTVFELPSDWKDRLLRCGPDERCAQDKLRGLGADIALVVIMNRTVDPPILDLRSIGQLSASLTQSTSRAESLMVDWANQHLTQAGYAKMGRLVVKVQPADSVVTVGERISHGPVAKLVLAPGNHAVLVERSDFDPQKIDVLVEPSSETQIDVSLKSQSVTWWPWAVGGGVVVAASVVTAVLVTRGSSCLCVKQMGTECVSSCP